MPIVAVLISDRLEMESDEEEQLEIKENRKTCLDEFQTHFKGRKIRI